MEKYVFFITVILILLCILVYLFMIINKHKFTIKLIQDRLINLDRIHKEQTSLFTDLQDEIKKYQDKNLDDERQKTMLQTRLEEQISINNQLKLRQDELDAKTKEYFELKTKEMSQNILNLNTKSLGENSQKILEQLINPLKSEIEKYQKESLNTSTIFKTNFDNLKNETKSIMEQAKSLAQALNGNKKVLGNWGEIQLDSVLQASGLVLGSNYFKQVAYKDKDGKQKFLDAVVDFGEGKKAIIDSKCSLVNYNAYFNAQDEPQKNEYAKALSMDIKTHIKNLSSKEYQDYDTKTYEYVFMFIPNDSIFYTALNSDSTIYEYAYEKGIFITTPLTLLMALKTVYICWRNLKSDENALKIINEAGRIYDKFAVFLEHFDKLENHLNMVSKDLQNSKITLFDGSGNLFDKLENLKNLGAKTNKKMIKKSSEIILEEEKIS